MRISVQLSKLFSGGSNSNNSNNSNGSNSHFNRKRANSDSLFSRGKGRFDDTVKSSATSNQTSPTNTDSQMVSPTQITKFTMSNECETVLVRRSDFMREKEQTELRRQISPNLDLSFQNRTEFPLPTNFEPIAKNGSLYYINIDVQGNKITSVPKEISSFVNLMRLNLSGNQLTSIPQEITSLKNLKNLNLSDNKLTAQSMEAFPLVDFDSHGNSINGFSQLSILNLSFNHLERIPSTIFDLTALSLLYLSGNFITEVPDNIEKLQELKVFSINHNKLTALNPILGRLIKLQVLIYQGNNIEDELLPIGTSVSFSDLKVLSLGQEFNASLNRLPNISLLRHLSMITRNSSDKMTCLNEAERMEQKHPKLMIQNNESSVHSFIIEADEYSSQDENPTMNKDDDAAGGEIPDFVDFPDIPAPLGVSEDTTDKEIPNIAFEELLDTNTEILNGLKTCYHCEQLITLPLSVPKASFDWDRHYRFLPSSEVAADSFAKSPRLSSFNERNSTSIQTSDLDIILSSYRMFESKSETLLLSESSKREYVGVCDETGQMHWHMICYGKWAQMEASSKLQPGDSELGVPADSPHKGISSPLSINDFTASIPPAIDPDAFGPKECAGCQQLMFPEGIFEAMGKFWHPECFVCRTCSVPLEGKYYNFDGFPYCRKHVKQAKGLTCRYCSGLLEGDFVEWNGSKYHPEHFTCAYCDKIIAQQCPFQPIPEEDEHPEKAPVSCLDCYMAKALEDVEAELEEHLKLEGRNKKA